jgi:zinc transport system substrate-binding protein
MRRLVLVLLLFALPATAKPLVLATIRPLTMIVAAVAGDAVEVRQLLPDGDSPHHWALKMSDRRLLDRADLVLWIGPDMETALVDGVAIRQVDGVITAIDLPQMQWPPPMPTEREGVRDAHIWLSPANAATIARAVADWLVRAHPEQQDAVRVRERAFIDSMARTQASVDARLASVRDRKFVVDHDGLRHFVAAFGLHQAGYFTDAGDRDIGAREMDRLLAQTDIRCLVVEPGHTGQMQQMARRLGARLAVVDPFGADVAPAPDAYGRFLAGIGEQLAECLGEKSVAKTQP